MIDGVRGEQLGGEHVGDHAEHIFAQLGVFRFIAFAIVEIIARRMLGRHDDRGRLDRALVGVAQRDLALGIGLEERRGARLAVGGHALEDLVAVIERRGHQVGGLVRGITEHDTLIARAFVLVAAFVDALRDMRRLGVEIILEAEAFPVKASLLVPDVLHRLAHGRLDLVERARCPLVILEHALATDFAGQHDELGGGQRLARDSGFGILRQEQVDDRIADLVGHLVGMSFGHAFGGEEEAVAHGEPSVNGYKGSFM